MITINLFATIYVYIPTFNASLWFERMRSLNAHKNVDHSIRMGFLVHLHFFLRMYSKLWLHIHKLAYKFNYSGLVEGTYVWFSSLFVYLLIDKHHVHDKHFVFNITWCHPFMSAVVVQWLNIETKAFLFEFFGIAHRITMIDLTQKNSKNKTKKYIRC